MKFGPNPLVHPSLGLCIHAAPWAIWAGRCVTFCGYELSPSGQASNWTWILPNWIWITHNLHKRRLGWDDVAQVASAFFHVEVRVASATCHVGVQLFVGLVHGRTCRKPWLSFTADNQKWYRESMGDSKDKKVSPNTCSAVFFGHVTGPSSNMIHTCSNMTSQSSQNRGNSMKFSNKAFPPWYSTLPRNHGLIGNGVA